MTLRVLLTQLLLKLMVFCYHIEKWCKKQLQHLENTRNEISEQSRKIPFKFSTLPVDVLDQILLSLPNYCTLQATVLSNRRFHEAYALHRNFVTNRVIIEELGHTLCFARALYLASTDLSAGITDDRFVSPESLLDEHIPAVEAKKLTRYCETAKGFETYFSRFWKDRTSAQSRLTELESFYFHRALYRYWTLVVFSCRRSWVNGDNYLRTAFLQHIGLDELRQVREVHALLFRLAKWPIGGDPITQFPDVLLSCVDTEQEMDDSFHFAHGIDLDDTLNALYGEHDISDVWNTEIASGLPILVHGNIHDVQCPRCHNSQVLLWGRSNWRLFKCFFTNGALYTLFPGQLCGNRLAIRRFGDLLDIRDSAQDALYLEILATDTGTDINNQWSREVYLCEACFLNCLREKVLAWHVRKLLRKGVKLRANCPNGWDCELQVSPVGNHAQDEPVEGMIHAKAFNHFCAPGGTDLPFVHDGTLVDGAIHMPVHAISMTSSMPGEYPAE